MLLSEIWYRAGKPHREGGLPSLTSRDIETGKLREEEYKVNGLFRTDGPAIVRYNRLGRVYSRRYSLDGHMLLPKRLQLG